MARFQGTPPNLTFTPTANYSGSDSFVFRANDGAVDSAAATVSITVNAVNDAPVASPQGLSFDEDTPTAITLSGTDVENSPLTYIVVTSPAHGTLSGTPPAVTFTPAANYFGTDSFTFKANDGSTDSSPATVSLEINSVNDLPTASSQSVNVSKNSLNNAITLTGSDVESTLTYVIVTSPNHGTLGGSGAARTYTPTTGYSGFDFFTFKVNDGTDDSSTATVSISVVNHAPTFSNLPATVTCMPLSALSFTAAATDSDGDTVSFALSPTGSTCPMTGITVSSGGVFAGNCPNIGRACVIAVDVTDGAMTSTANYTLNFNTRYVAPTASGLADGTSWGDATASLKIAADTLLNGGHIWIAKGTYRFQGVPQPTPMMSLRPNTEAYGGFEGNEQTFSQRPSPVSATLTQINGDANSNNIPESSSDAPVAVQLTTSSRLDGVEIRQFWPAGSAAPVICTSSINARLSNVRVVNNEGNGAPILVSGGCQLTLDDTFIAHNRNTGSTGAFYGGGAQVDGSSSSITFNRALIFNNQATARFAGAISSINGGAVTINDSLLLQNNAALSGDAIYFVSTGPLTINRSALIMNTSNYSLDDTGTIHMQFGGPVALQDVRVIDPAYVGASTLVSHSGILLAGSGTATLTNVMVRGVRSGCSAGGIRLNGYTMTLSNSTITDNRVAQNSCGFGGGVLTSSSSTSTITNTAFYDNLEGVTGRDHRLVGTGVLAGNTYNCSANLPAGTGNQTLIASPFSADVAKNPFLSQLSACVNTGDTTGANSAFPLWAQYTTNQASYLLDTGTVDIGFHTDTAQPRLDAFSANATSYSWTVGRNYTSCQVYNWTTGTMTATAGAIGVSSHGSASGTRLTLMCNSSKGWGTGIAAHVTVP